jgi:hypothetical protein
MKRHFLIATDNLSRDDSRAVSDHIKALKVGWWHWIDNLWLIATEKDEVDATDLRDAIIELVAPANVLVVEFAEPVTWAGYGPSTNRKNMFAWLQNHMVGQS